MSGLGFANETLGVVANDLLLRAFGNDTLSGGLDAGARGVFRFSLRSEHDRIYHFDQAESDHVKLDASLCSDTDPSALSMQDVANLFGSLNATETIAALP